MSERKVLNKYYPPDFDPTKLPKLKRGRNRQFVIRIMAPFSMRCKTCGEYIYKGRKFNSRMETVEDENYLGLRIYRFYIRCTKCISEITFKTDPENTDYVMEHGATRNFEAVRRLGQMLEMEKEAREEEEANNPMKALENRTRDSKREMESLEKLEELRDLNQRIAGIDPATMIQSHLKEEERTLKKQEEDDEKLIREMFGGGQIDGYVKRLIDNDSDSDEEKNKNKQSTSSNSSSSSKRAATDILTEETPSGEIAGPSYKPSKKIKLKTPFDELSTMVRLKNTKKEKPRKVESSETSTSINVSTEPEVSVLPAYKINLKKAVKKDVKMKGASLNLLGGYGSSESD